MGVLRAMSQNAMRERRAINHNAPQSYHETPDGYEPHLNIENVCQGVTPLHLVCSTGLSDCVNLLACWGVRFDILDWTDPGRDAYQFAKRIWKARG